MSDGQAAQSTGGELASRIEAGGERRRRKRTGPILNSDLVYGDADGTGVYCFPRPRVGGGHGGRWIGRKTTCRAVLFAGVLVRVESLGLLPGPARSMDFGVAVASRHAPPFISHAFFFFFICLPHVLYGIALNSSLKQHST